MSSIESPAPTTKARTRRLAPGRGHEARLDVLIEGNIVARPSNAKSGHLVPLKRAGAPHC